MAKVVSVKLLFSLAAVLKWSLIQLDVSNGFLNGDCRKKLRWICPSVMLVAWGNRYHTRP